MIVIPQSLTQILIFFSPNYQFFVDSVGRELFVTKYDATIPQTYPQIRVSGKTLDKAVKDFLKNGTPLEVTFSQNPL